MTYFSVRKSSIPPLSWRPGHAAPEGFDQFLAVIISMHAMNKRPIGLMARQGEHHRGYGSVALRF